MATRKYISPSNLSSFLNNLKTLFATKTEMSYKSDKNHKHAISDITNLQSTLDGKAASSHGTHVSFSSTAPVMDGTANVGSASTVARSDHRHPTDTSRAAQTSLDSHTSNTTSHITTTERNKWDTAYTHSQSAHAPSNAEANQNAFSNIVVGSTTIAADKVSDSIILVGSNVTLTPDVNNDKITISVADGSTSGKGIVQLTNSTSSTSTTTAATPSSVKSAYDLANTAKTAAQNAQTTADSKANASHTHTVANITDLTATAKELNYMDGATSNVQTQLDTLDSTKAKRISLKGQCQITSYRTSVIALCKAPTDAYCGGAINSYSAGQLTLHRNNGLYAPVIATLSMGASHGAINRVRFRGLCSSGFSIFKPCTFTYNGISYGGVEFKTSDAEAHSVTFVGETTFDIFALDIYDSNQKVVLNEEVYNSISYDNALVETGWKDTSNTFITSENISSQSVASATKDGNGKVISSTYETKTDATNKLSTAKAYADSAATKVKNDLLNNAGAAYDTLKELGDLIDDNTDAIDALETVASSKANASDLTSHTSNKSNPHGVTMAQLGIGAAGSSLGLVKTGGDVTISSGVITVNDDSHNHTIANVDNLQTSLDAKQNTITGGATTITGSNLTANRALISNGSGKVVVSAVTSTELGYLDGVTSNVQTQLDGKAASSHTHSISNVSGLQSALDGKSATSHTHSYAGSPSVGGSATSAVKLDTSTAGDANTPVYFTGGKPVACTSLDLNTTGSSASCTGNSATATQLKTARTIGLGDGATGTATSFNGTENITIPVTAVKESYLTWGGKNLSGSVSPLSAALSTEHSANRIAYLNPNAIKVEYSNDAGSTWTDSGLANSAKINLVTTSNGIGVGSNSTVTTNHRTRITLTAQDGTNGYVYTRPRKMLINVSTAGHGLTVTIEAKTGASGASWTTLGTYPLSGWSGWNDIPIDISTFGGGANQTSNYWYMRLTFANTSVNSSYTTTKSSIIGLRLFGDTCWTRTSNMGETGHLYSYDSSQNATFPANVTATTFVGALSGNATTATTATKLGSSTVGSVTQPVYINNGTATACTYTLGKSVPSNAVFTDTNTKVTNTLATTTKAYITGTTSASTNTGTQVFDTGVYLDTTAGQLTATAFNGSTFKGSGVATLAEVKSYLGI